MCLQVREGKGVCRLCIPVCKAEMRTGERKGNGGQVRGGGGWTYGYGGAVYLFVRDVEWDRR